MVKKNSHIGGAVITDPLDSGTTWQDFLKTP